MIIPSTLSNVSPGALIIDKTNITYNYSTCNYPKGYRVISTTRCTHLIIERDYSKMNIHHFLTRNWQRSREYLHFRTPTIPRIFSILRRKLTFVRKHRNLGYRNEFAFVARFCKMTKYILRWDLFLSYRIVPFRGFQRMSFLCHIKVER